jgi:hypothetical protein
MAGGLLNAFETHQLSFCSCDLGGSRLLNRRRLQKIGFSALSAEAKGWFIIRLRQEFVEPAREITGQGVDLRKRNAMISPTAA